MQAFLEYLHNHSNDITVVYPNKQDIEQYVFDLEDRYYKMYKQQLKVKGYIQFDDYKEKDCGGFANYYCVDPRCLIQEIKNNELFVEELEEVINKWKRKHN